MPVRLFMLIAVFTSYCTILAQPQSDTTKELLFFSDDVEAGDENEAVASFDEKKGENDSIGILDRANLDMQVVYGQYNNMLSTINLSQERGGFAYFLRSNYKRSNDFGYKSTTYENTSYFENSLEFTGNLSLDDRFTSIFMAGVENDSRGMFDKADYSREEKEKVTLYSKNIKKFSNKFEAHAVLNTAFYKHRLENRQEDVESVRSSLTRYSGGIGGEYIWSSSNRIMFDSKFTQYLYTDSKTDNDRYATGKLVDDFKISDLLGANFGVSLAWNRDIGIFVWDEEAFPLPLMPIAGLTFYGNDYYTIYVNYRYELKPFVPEEYYFSLNYISPNYDLLPAKVHYTDLQLDLIAQSFFSVKSVLSYEDSDNFYNYMPAEHSENLLTAHSLAAQIVSFSTDLDLNIIGKELRFIGGYRFKKFTADENMTYIPLNTYVAGLMYEGSRVNVDWTNEFLGSVYVDPEKKRTLDSATVGYLDVQFKTIESFYAYLRLENLYNSKYYLREGYPETGLTVLFGLRILM